MDATVRLRIATRIHFALLRHYGEDVDASTLLRGGEAAREALWVCEASEHAELVALGRQFNAMLTTDAEARTQRFRHLVEAERSAPQEAAWARDTSGFGTTRADAPAEAGEPAPAAANPWFKPGRWLKRVSVRSTR